MGYPLYLRGPAESYRIVQNDAERAAALAQGFWQWTKDAPFGPPAAGAREPDIKPARRPRGRPRLDEQE